MAFRPSRPAGFEASETNCRGRYIVFIAQFYARHYVPGPLTACPDVRCLALKAMRPKLAFMRTDGRTPSHSLTTVQ